MLAEQASRQQMEAEVSSLVMARLEETKVRAKQLVDKARRSMRTAEDRALAAESAAAEAQRQVREERLSRCASDKTFAARREAEDAQQRALADHQQLADEATTQFALAKARLRDALEDAQAICATSELTLRAENDRRLDAFVAGISAERTQLEQAQVALQAAKTGKGETSQGCPLPGEDAMASVAAALDAVEVEANRLTSRHRSTTVTSRSREQQLLAAMEGIKADYESLDLAWGADVRRLQDDTQQQLAAAERKLQMRLGGGGNGIDPEGGDVSGAGATEMPPVDVVAAEVADTCYKVQVGDNALRLCVLHPPPRASHRAIINSTTTTTTTTTTTGTTTTATTTTTITKQQ